MICCTKFDPNKDISEVIISSAYVDLDKAIESGTIEASAENLSYNGIEDPASISGRVEDTFDAINALNSIKARARQSEAAKAAESSAIAENSD